ncbi:MAG: hypothetical protein OXC12_07315 [Spirochaetaceae bacterium]|nr:hypothetical protein [Spirochaetaceae bacterium]
MRLPDLPAFVRSLGFSTEVISVDTFLATSIRHRGEQPGSFFAGAKEGRDGDRERARAQIGA